MNKDKEFFDSCAANWDNIRETNPVKLLKLVQMAQIKKDDKIMDVGTGTGVLLPYLLAAIGKGGHITAVDFSENMLTHAKAKHHEENISFIAGDILQLKLPQNKFNAITCLNFYPHLHQHKEFFLEKMLPLLKENGTLTIFHDISRAQVNSIHAECEEVKEHRLPPASEVGALMQKAGYQLVQAYDDDDIYFVQGQKR